VAPGSVAVARVLGARGIHGEITVDPLAPPGLLAADRQITIAGRGYVIEQSRAQGRTAVLKLSGIDDRTAAEALRGHYLEIPEAELEPLAEGEYYRFQLIGLRVLSNEGEELGRVADVMSTPANDVYVVQGPRGEVLVPALDAVVLAVDLGARTMTIEVVPGLLPPPRKERG